MRRIAPIATLCLALLGIGCEPDYYSVLIRAQSEVDVSTIVVRVISIQAGERRGSSEVMRRIDRSRDSIAEDPIRIAVDLEAPREVMVHVTATNLDGQRLVATRCYLVDRVIEDNVMLVVAGTELDADGDGFPNDPRTTCFDPVEGAPGERRECAQAFACPREVAADCDDRPPCADGDPTCVPPESIFPGAQETCQDMIDQDCNGADADCTDDDMDGFRLCSATDAPGSCDCDDTNPNVNPGVEEGFELCRDGIDQDCRDGDAKCDNDGDGFAAETDVGGSPDCDDTDDAVFPGATEICTPPGEIPRDEDCDGLLDELQECAPEDMDRDGVPSCIVAPGAGCDCNDCDPGVRPGLVDQCQDGVDQDCDGTDPMCPAGDTDLDGAAAVTAGGNDCNDSDPRTYVGAPELCGDGVAQSCGADADCGADLDGDMYVEPEGCEADASITPYATEVCDGIDQDCDGVTDDLLNPPGMMAFPNGDTGCVIANPTTPECEAGSSCTIDFRSSIFHCGGCRANCNPGATNVALECTDGSCNCPSETGIGPCLAGQTCCPVGGFEGAMGTGCRDLQADFDNCGACGLTCDSKATNQCSGGMCQCGVGGPCGAGQRCCGSGDSAVCVADNDTQNCGACGTICGNNSSCAPAGATFRCQCNAGRADCNGDNGSPGNNGCEINTTNDAGNCGACGNGCNRPNATATCVSSNCQIGSCNVTHGDCNGNDSDGCEQRLDRVNHCGGCRVVCSRTNATPACPGRNCQIGSCNALFDDCDGNDANGCETQLNTTTNCNGCGTACSPPRTTSATCPGGTCTVGTCQGGWGNCDGANGNGCEQTLTTTTHCTACRTSCTRTNATATCASGACLIGSCSGNFGNCDGSDPNGCEQALNTTTHCTACSTPCTAPPMGMADCSSGSCQFTCLGGFHACGATCESDTDPNNCGASCVTCNDPSNGSPTCVAGSCGVSCDGGYHECSGGVCESDTDPDNCGASCTNCANRANSTRTCVAGSCGFTCNMGFGDCDGMTSTGCEADFSSDYPHCGACSACNSTTSDSCGAGGCECNGSAECGGGQVCCPSGGVVGCNGMGSCD